MRFRERLQRFMYGRYGVDGFNQWMTYFVLGLLILNLFIKSSILSLAADVLLILCIFRMLSRNTVKRSQENAKFYQIKGKITGWWKSRIQLAKQLKEYHIYKCPSCKQKIRIPRGKGKICVTCPKCRTEFIKKADRVTIPCWCEYFTPVFSCK